MLDVSGIFITWSPGDHLNMAPTERQHEGVAERGAWPLSEGDRSKPGKTHSRGRVHVPQAAR